MNIPCELSRLCRHCLFYRLIAAICAISAAAQAIGAPRIVCEEASFDFGDRSAGTLLEHQFKVRNEGDSPLQIHKIHAACGCTTAELASNTLAPGAETILVAKLSLPSAAGKQDKTITVESDDPKTPTLILHLKGNVIKGAHAEPEAAMFGRVGTTSSASVDVEIVPGEFPVEVESVSVEGSSAIHAELQQDSKGKRIKVAMKPPLSLGQLEGVVIVRFKKDLPSPLTIIVGAYVIGDLGVSPPELVVMSDPEQILTRYVTISPGTVKQFKITKVEVPMPSITAKVVEAPDGAYRVRLRGPLAAEEVVGKSIRIFTDISGKSVVEIPVRQVAGEALEARTAEATPTTQP